MNINTERVRQRLQNFELNDLFTQELGWDHHSETLPIHVDDTEYLLTACAEKRGMAVFSCTAPPGADIPDYATRSKIEREVAKSAHEHLIIFANHAQTTQIWQWAKREAGKPVQRREQTYDRSRQAGEALIQKLLSIAFSFEEEDELTLMDVTSRARAAFDVEKVTKRFYDQFKKEHDAFLKFLDGIPDEGMQRWYVSVILNRLMFIYFIQKKGFLDNDRNYLRTKLSLSRQTGADRYYNDFLCPLFFEGFAKPKAERSRDMSRLLGDVPYLNGGIFQKRQIEARHGETIQIPDAAFERLFTFFERYQWHLDDRPLRRDDEINPDVLGYIFEKYINQKQMGAYYTKEDITEYISKNTIIPFLLEATRKKCEIAFEPPADPHAASVWQLLVRQPERYIYDAVKHGTEHELPPDIAAGIDDVSARTGWNAAAPPEFGLPTEIWREVAARRTRYHEVRAKLSNGEIHEVDDLITYNLDIRQFAQDIIENCEGPDLLRAFWKAINAVTVLDPTCGSGAFLFAALNILEPLYEACLDRMQVFLDESEGGLGGSDQRARSSGKFSDFRAVLDQIKKHPNRTYFILKSIIINNLYGVDIMEEAIEICKLRLFLKMVAQIENVNQIEPLPDIDFNIKAGNTLVGYAAYDDVHRAVTENRIDFDNVMDEIKEKAEDVEELFNQFRAQQTRLGGDVSPAAKQRLQDKLEALDDELNRYLADEYNVDSANESAYQKWLNSHKPFHWFIEFYGILKNGGFDVIIGNPPYVEYTKVRKSYTIKGYETESCGNLYAFVMERGTRLNSGRVGWIVPISWVSTNRMAAARYFITNSHPKLYISNHADRPSSLFEGVHQKLSIVLCDRGNPGIHTTGFNRCYSKKGERDHLFYTLSYHLQQWDRGILRKFSSDVEEAVFHKITAKSTPITSTFASARRMNQERPFYLNQRLMMWVKCFLAPKRSNEFRTIYPDKGFAAEELSAVLNSSLFFWFWEARGDCWHLTKGDMDDFRIDLNQFSQAERQSLVDLARTLELHLEANKEYVGTVQTEYEYYHRKSKHIIDNIDRVLAKHYGFTNEELDFIINYEIKYRMGLGSGD